MVLHLISRFLGAHLLSALIFFGAFSLRCPAATWLPFGPDGGDARTFAFDPHDHLHLYLGTTTGWIYESRTGGQSWKRLARVDNRDDLVLDNIVVDASNSRRLLVGAWVLGSSGGGLYISNDAGTTWFSQPEMSGQAVLALADAPSDPKTIVAGTLGGVFRSTDGGLRWHQISPPDSKEIHEVESIAIDPKDPQVIYAGTWHLPWKTTDGGQTWENIKQGIIDDSDVFSIIIDPSTPTTVYASACSGIYKSDNAGELFHKIQGIPSTARRTRVLQQDPKNLDIVFAGTTEGLFRTVDAGRTWSRTTGPEIIVNDVFIDQTDPRHVLLATDRGGVLMSDDGGDSFQPANQGFSSRQITAFQNTGDGTVYVGVVNDKEWGGVFASNNGGLNWSQRSAGLEGRDVFSLGHTSTGTLLAGTSHGIFRLAEDTWQRIEDAPSTTEALIAAPIHRKAAVVPQKKPVIKTSTKIKTTASHSPSPELVSKRKIAAKQAPTRPGATTTRAGLQRAVSTLPLGTRPGQSTLTEKVQQKPAPVHGFDSAVFAFASTSNTILAATPQGLLVSLDDALSWQPSQVLPADDWRFLAAANSWVAAGTLHDLFRSSDGGKSWKPVTLPPSLTQIASVCIDDTGQLWTGGREGIFVSSDGGISWSTPKNLFLSSVNSIFYDQATQRVMVTTNSSSTLVFTVQLPDKSVTFTDTGWHLRFVRPVGDHLIGATLFDGIVVQPRMVASPESVSR